MLDRPEHAHCCPILTNATDRGARGGVLSMRQHELQTRLDPQNQPQRRSQRCDMSGRLCLLVKSGHCKESEQATIEPVIRVAA